ncbi:uncharacterized protein LOC120408711 [Mauremys reevesii]|uniref:uncharacterized protein LOC120408711 n=1 Tax=Mauremys reevesii TaxID=260615 RepID=UPI00193F8679|nr:uncharacterized protein LOC120408711 [Mauremys reevesii]
MKKGDGSEVERQKYHHVGKRRRRENRWRNRLHHQQGMVFKNHCLKVQMFSHYVEMQKILSSWKESNTILLYKKGNHEALKNYPPIYLLSYIYKLFTKTTNGLSQSLDEQQLREQASFQRNFSTMDHIFTINQLLESSREYKFPLCISFIDYEKTFNNVEIYAVSKALAEKGINTNYITLLKEANSNCTTDITLFDIPLRIPVKKGVKQGNMVSLKLFTGCLKMVMGWMNWKGGININGQQLSHLRFMDDIC